MSTAKRKRTALAVARSAATPAVTVETEPVSKAVMMPPGERAQVLIRSTRSNLDVRLAAGDSFVVTVTPDLRWSLEVRHPDGCTEPLIPEPVDMDAVTRFNCDFYTRKG